MNNPPAKSLDGIYNKLQQGFNKLCKTLINLFPHHNNHISFLLEGDSDYFIFDPNLLVDQIEVEINTITSNYSYRPKIISYTILDGTATVEANTNVSNALPSGLSESVEASDTIATYFEVYPETPSSKVYVSIIY